MRLIPRILGSIASRAAINIGRRLVRENRIRREGYAEGYSDGFARRKPQYPVTKR